MLPKCPKNHSLQVPIIIKSMIFNKKKKKWSWQGLALVGMPCAKRMPNHVKTTFSSKFLCHNFTTHKTWFLGPAPSDGTQKYRTVSFLRSSQFFPIGKIKKYTSGLKKILKIFPSATDIILSVSAKNLDFIPYGSFLWFSLFFWIGKIKNILPCWKKFWKFFSMLLTLVLLSLQKISILYHILN